MALEDKEEQEETPVASSPYSGLEPADSAGAPGLENAEFLNGYWDGTIPLMEAQVLDILASS